jgi:hypothetical protein
VHASPLYSGSVVATWSTPLLSGTAYDGATGVRQNLDNTTSANCNLSGCPVLLTGYGTDTVAWGVDPGLVGAPQTSVVTFTGHSFSGVRPGDDVDFGTITYTNGTSLDGTIIFGATLTLSFVVTAGAAIDTRIDVVPIATTENTGTAAQNADWVGPFNTNSGTPPSFNVYEGATATAELFGTITGDPIVELTKLVLNPGQDEFAFIGDGQPLVPEPATASLLGPGLLGLAMAYWRRRKLN